MKFRIEFKMDNRLMRDYFKTCVYDKWLKGGLPLISVGVVLVITGILMRTETISLGLSENGIGGWMMLGYVLVLFGLFFLLQPYFMAAVVMRRFRKAWGGVTPTTVLTVGDDCAAQDTGWDEDEVTSYVPGIHYSEGESELDFPFDNIHAIFEGKLGYYLNQARYVGVMVKKGCFTEGEESEFLPYVRENCRNAY